MIVVAAAVLIHEDKVLLTRRLDDAHLAGQWEFPGGKLEDGEAPEDAVVRELQEECGIDIAVDDILDVTFHRFPEKSVLLLFYACSFAGDVQDVKHLGVQEHAFVTKDEFPNYTLPPADVEVVEKVRALLELLE